MKIQCTDIIRIAPVQTLKNIRGKRFSLMDGNPFDTIRCMNYPTPSEETGNSNVGMYNLFYLKVEAEKFSGKLDKKYGIQNNVILILYRKDKNESMVVGNPENPVTMIRVPEKGTELLSFTRSSFISVL